MESDPKRRRLNSDDSEPKGLDTTFASEQAGTGVTPPSASVAGGLEQFLDAKPGASVDDGSELKAGIGPDRQQPPDDKVSDGNKRSADALPSTSEAAGQGNAGPNSPTPQATREVWIRREAQDDGSSLDFQCINNCGEEQHLIWLINLKNIFAKQLPNMPKEYIVRLLFDRNHDSMIALKNNNVVGGITFRSFIRQGFAEIAFCAVTVTEQVKGYGTKLMNHLKEFAREHHKITHFLTYADNNAVGYFVKQGFSKEILLERDRWYGYIKDYDGGTMMECALAASISHTDLPRMIHLQREAVEAKVRELSASHVVYPGLRFWKDAGPKGAVLPLDQLQGLREAGWTPAQGRPKFQVVTGPSGKNVQEPTRQALHTLMREVLYTVMDHGDAWPFMEAVDARDVPDYYQIITDPVDLGSMKRRLSSGEYYITLEIFAADFRRMCENCRIYNAPDTVYFKCAQRLEQFFEQRLAAGVIWT